MENHFILDTNAYRRIAETKYFVEIRPTAHEMRVRESKTNSHSLMSVVVSMELLKHFDDTDPFFRTCFKALALQYYHTQTKTFGEPGNEIRFIPPLDTLITQFFFNRNAPIFQYYKRVIEIVQNATKDLKLSAYKIDNSDIEIVRQQLIHERTEIKENLEEFLRVCNKGVVDWKLFQNDKPLRKTLFGDMKMGRTKIALALSILRRTHSILNLPYPQENLEDRFKDFLAFFEPLLNLNQTIIEKLGNGVIALSDPLDKKYNTLNDVQILGAACFNSFYERNNNVRTIIVTDDEAIHTASKENYMENNIWKVNRYLSFIY